MHLPFSTPNKGAFCWYFAVVGPLACSVDWTEAGVIGAAALGWGSCILVSSRCMSKDVLSPRIVPAPWMRILPKPSNAMDDHKINKCCPNLVD